MGGNPLYTAEGQAELQRAAAEITSTAGGLPTSPFPERKDYNAAAGYFYAGEVTYSATTETYTVVHPGDALLTAERAKQLNGSKCLTPRGSTSCGPDPYKNWKKNQPIPKEFWPQEWIDAKEKGDKAWKTDMLAWTAKAEVIAHGGSKLSDYITAFDSIDIEGIIGTKYREAVVMMQKQANRYAEASTALREAWVTHTLPATQLSSVARKPARGQSNAMYNLATAGQHAGNVFRKPESGMTNTPFIQTVDLPDSDIQKGGVSNSSNKHRFVQIMSQPHRDMGVDGLNICDVRSGGILNAEGPRFTQAMHDGQERSWIYGRTMSDYDSKRGSKFGLGFLAPPSSDDPSSFSFEDANQNGKTARIVPGDVAKQGVFLEPYHPIPSDKKESEVTRDSPNGREIAYYKFLFNYYVSLMACQTLQSTGIIDKFFVQKFRERVPQSVRWLKTYAVKDKNLMDGYTSPASVAPVRTDVYGDYSGDGRLGEPIPPWSLHTMIDGVYWLEWSQEQNSAPAGAEGRKEYHAAQRAGTTDIQREGDALGQFFTSERKWAAKIEKAADPEMGGWKFLDIFQAAIGDQSQINLTPASAWLTDRSTRVGYAGVTDRSAGDTRPMYATSRDPKIGLGEVDPFTRPYSSIAEVQGAERPKQHRRIYWDRDAANAMAAVKKGESKGDHVSDETLARQHGSTAVTTQHSLWKYERSSEHERYGAPTNLALLNENGVLYSTIRELGDKIIELTGGELVEQDRASITAIKRFAASAGVHTNKMRNSLLAISAAYNTIEDAADELTEKIDAARAAAGLPPAEESALVDALMADSLGVLEELQLSIKDMTAAYYSNNPEKAFFKEQCYLLTNIQSITQYKKHVVDAFRYKWQITDSDYLKAKWPSTSEETGKETMMYTEALAQYEVQREIEAGRLWDDVDPGDSLLVGGEDRMIKATHIREMQANPRYAGVSKHLERLRQLSGKQFGPELMKEYNYAPAGGEGLNKKLLPYVGYQGDLAAKYGFEQYNSSLMIDGDPYGFLNRLLLSHYQKSLHNIDHKVISLLQPYVRLWKVTFDENANEVDTEVKFDAYRTEKEDLLFQKRKLRNTGVGLKHFQFTYDGSNPFGAKKSIKGQLKIFSNTFDELLIDRNGYKYVDLALKTSNTPTLKAVRRENEDLAKLNFRLKAQVGWTPPSNETLQRLRLTQTEASELIDTLLDSIVTLNLTPTIHDFGIDELGRVDFTINYLAYVEELYDTGKFNVFSEATVAAGRYVRALQMKEAKQNCKDEALEKLKEAHALAADNEVADSISHLIGRMIKLDRIYYMPVDGHTIREFISRGPFATGFTVPQVPVLNSREKASYDAKVIDEALDKYRDHSSSGNTGDVPIGEEEIKITQGLATMDLSREVLSFFYFSDLVDTLLSNIEQELEKIPEALASYASAGGVYNKEDLESTVKEYQRYQKAFRKIRFLLGPLELVHPAKGKSVFINLGDVPISVKYFIEWLTSTMLKRNSSYFSLTAFMNKFVNELLRKFLNNDDCFGYNIRQNVRLNQSVYTGPQDISNRSARERAYVADGFVKDPITQTYLKPMGARGESRRMNIRNMPSPVLRDKDRPSALSTIPSYDEVNYMIYYVGRTMPTELMNGDKGADEDRGIYHYQIGRHSGITKTIKLKKTVTPGLQEVRFEQEGYDGLEQLRVVYDATIESYVNPNTFPGTYIYIEPAGFSPSFGSSTITSEGAYDLTDFGIGGYYMIVRSTHVFGPGEASTSIEAKWVNAIDKGRAEELKQAAGAEDRVKSDCTHQIERATAAYEE